VEYFTRWIGTGPTVSVISVLQHFAFDNGSSLSTWVINLHVELDQQLDKRVLMPSVTLPGASISMGQGGHVPTPQIF